MRKKELLVVGLLICICASVGSVLDADEAEGRPRVKDFTFEFSPSQQQVAGVPQLKVCVVPLINSNDLSRHTKNLDKALRNITPEEVQRVLGIRFTGTGKPQNRFLTAEPFEEIVGAALKQELAALGMEIVPAPTAAPPENLLSKTLLELVDKLPAEDLPDILVAAEIEDFYFQTLPGMWKLKMETFFVLDVRVVDVAAREILWEGTVEAGELEKKAAYMGNEAVETRLNAAFQVLIEGLLRDNSELQEALGGLG